MYVKTEVANSNKIIITLSPKEVGTLAIGNSVNSADEQSPFRIHPENPYDYEMVISQLQAELAAKSDIGLQSEPTEFIAEYEIIIPTIGASEYRIRSLLKSLTRSNPCPKTIVADNGGGFGLRKSEVCNSLAATYLKPSGDVGVSQNISRAIDSTESPWVCVVDDGSRVHHCWVSFVREMIHAVPEDVVMIGSSHIQDWMLVVCGLLSTQFGPKEWFYKTPGLIGRMSREFCWSDKGHSIEFGELLIDVDLCDIPEIDLFIEQQFRREPDKSDLEESLSWHKYQTSGRWPQSEKTLRECWSPGAQGLLIRKEFLDEIGGLHPTCSAYEIWLACMAAERGYRVMVYDGPPWLHMPSLGFTEAGRWGLKVKQTSIYDICESRWGIREPFDVIRKYRS